MDTKYLNLKFESNNKTLEVGKGKSFRLLNIDGVDSGENELFITSNVLHDGSKITNKKIKSRPIMIEIEYKGTDKERKRSEIASFFNIHKEGILIIDYQGIKRSIRYNSESYKAKLSNLYEPFSFMVHLYCPNPYWQDIEESTREITTWIGGMSFPLRLPTQFSIAGEKVINIINNGDVETPVRLEITGTATNPKIIKRDTGEFIKVNRTLTGDDTLVITTDFGNKRVEQNGLNVFNYIDLQSKFFDLDVGDNVIELITEDVNDNANVKITYKNRYLGV